MLSKKEILALVGFAVFILILNGCKQTTPSLRLDPNSPESAKVMESGPQVVGELGKNVQVTAGEPAVISENKEETTQTVDDKPGAVAVKVGY